MRHVPMNEKHFKTKVWTFAEDNIKIKKSHSQWWLPCRHLVADFW